MTDLMKPVMVNDSEHLFALIKQLIQEKHYEGVKLLFVNNNEANRNEQYLPTISMNLYHEICVKNLNDKVYKDNSPLYICAEELLKKVASHGPFAEVLYELLDLVEESNSEFVFSSVLRALQTILLREDKLIPFAFEYGLNSVYNNLQKLQVPDYLVYGYDAQQKYLLEQDDEIQHLLMKYITVGLFYDPLVCLVCSQSRNLFRDVGNTRRNVMCCFLIKLLGIPLSLLDLSKGCEKKTDTYSFQCAKSITQGVTTCLEDPLFLLTFVETRARFKRRIDGARGVYEMSSHNIFLIEDKLPLDCLGIYYYMVFVEGIDLQGIPKVYNTHYILESCLYLVYKLLEQPKFALHEKALLLMDKLLLKLNGNLILVSSLDLDIHKSFCITLCNLVAYSAQPHIRQLGLRVLKLYILSFEDEGKYLILKNLTKILNHDDLRGYLVTIYKDLVGGALQNSTQLPSCFCGQDFRNLFEQFCTLPQNIETDLLQNKTTIISSLNAIRYFTIKDIENRTGFWNFYLYIEETYLNTLRKSLDLARVHFKAELNKIESGSDGVELNNVNIDVANDSKDAKLDIGLDKSMQIDVLKRNILIFDVIDNILSRACECLTEFANARLKNKAKTNIVNENVENN